jgi:hypothetical protein
MDEHAQETYKSMLSISVEGMKALLLINGGAVVFLLTFSGNSKIGKDLAPHAGTSVGAFVFGVVFGILTFAFSYATQFALFNESIRPDSYSGPKHMVFVKISVLFVFLGLIAFIVGCCTSVSLLIHYNG